MAERILNESWIVELLPEDIVETLAALDLSMYLSKALEVFSIGLTSAVGMVMTVFSTLVNIILSLIFAIYLLLSRDKLMEQGSRLLKHYLRPKASSRILYVLSIFNKSFRVTLLASAPRQSSWAYLYPGHADLPLPLCRHESGRWWVSLR